MHGWLDGGSPGFRATWKSEQRGRGYEDEAGGVDDGGVGSMVNRMAPILFTEFTMYPTYKSTR